MRDGWIGREVIGPIQYFKIVYCSPSIFIQIYVVFWLDLVLERIRMSGVNWIMKCSIAPL